MNEATIETNYIRHINAFYSLVREDTRLHAIHVSLYLALFQIWNQHRFQNPFPILREEVINLSRIGSLNTYTKAIKVLHQLGYIEYMPSGSMWEKSMVNMLRLDKATIRPNQLLEDGRKNEHAPVAKVYTAQSQNCDARGRKNDTVPVADLRLFNNKQIDNKTRERENGFSPTQKKIHSSKTKNAENETGITFQPPGLREVQEFFRQSAYPANEAAKFYYHYQANGWLQGGKTKITNWEAAAHKWVLGVNPQKDTHHEQRSSKPGKLHVDQNKSYSDPL